METDNQKEIFRFLKEKLEQDFGVIPDSMLYALRDICAAFPDFIAFFKRSNCGSILAALSLYFEQLQKTDKKEYVFVYLKEKEQKSVLYYLLIGFTLFKAIRLFKKNTLGQKGPPPP
jgi:hypothetical protein